MKAIIFGSNGQDGYYLTQLCKSKNIETIGVSRTGKGELGDISSFEQVKYLVKEHQPDYVFHLAANSTTRHDALFENHETISTGTINVLESVRRYCGNAKVFITGSGIQFKNSGVPISEHDEFEANCPYSVARIQSVYAARYYRSLGIKAYVGYLFHHESPLRKPNHVSQIVASLARKVASNENEVIELGNIEVEKEWVFAGDVVNAIFKLVDQDDVYEATIGSGITYSIKDWLDHCFKLIGREWNSHITIIEGYIPEYQKLVSNPETMATIGWVPEIGISELAEIMLSTSITD